MVVSLRGERRPLTLIWVSVRRIFLPSHFSVESFGPEAARSLFFQLKGKWKERQLICPRVNQCCLQLLSACVLSRILSFTLCSSLDEGERAIGTEFTGTTGIFIIPFLKQQNREYKGQKPRNHLVEKIQGIGISSKC